VFFLGPPPVVLVVLLWLGDHLRNNLNLIMKFEYHTPEITALLSPVLFLPPPTLTRVPTLFLEPFAFASLQSRYAYFRLEQEIHNLRFSRFEI
jgi:hypothetical protein